MSSVEFKKRSVTVSILRVKGPIIGEHDLYNRHIHAEWRKGKEVYSSLFQYLAPSK